MLVKATSRTAEDVSDKMNLGSAGILGGVTDGSVMITKSIDMVSTVTMILDIVVVNRTSERDTRRTQLLLIRVQHRHMRNACTGDVMDTVIVDCNRSAQEKSSVTNQLPKLVTKVLHME